MHKNLVILTAGLSGSSVVTSLVAQGGFWTGGDTFKKSDYDTYENTKLIELNERLVNAVGFQGSYERVFDLEVAKRMPGLLGSVDLAPYKAFIEACNAHKPWVWKDPRLWLTISFWQHLLDLSDVRFLVLMREDLQTWISSTNRRHIQTFSYLKRYNHSIRDSIGAVMTDTGAEYMEMYYESLLLNPERTIRDINEFLGTNLSVGDLKRVYRGKLYRRPKGVLDFLKAVAIYAKNYSSRDR